MIDIDAALRLVSRAVEMNLDFLGEEPNFVRRVHGGMNNALYHVSLDGIEVACKLCVPDERQRARREHSALRLLWESGIDLAPKPCGLDESLRWLPYPTVLYAWLPGEPLGSAPTHEQWRELQHNYQRLHALRSESFPEAALPVAFFHWLDRSPYLDELSGFLSDLGPWLRDSRRDGPQLYTRLEGLVEGCRARFAAQHVELGPEAVSLRLCRVDPNPANIILGPDARLRWVDWEYSGWGDPALDLADLRWHAAFLDLPLSWHAQFRAGYQPPEGDPAFGQRLSLWDDLLSVRWPFLVLRLLWSQAKGPDRLRLTRPSMEPMTLWTRFERLLARAEAWSAIPPA
jgi:Ser/Thr protein kinase RdoA (MazF antagonist)